MCLKRGIAKLESYMLDKWLLLLMRMRENL